MIMSKIKYYTDSMVLAVVFNEYEAVKTLIENGNYDKTVFKDIGSDYYFDIPIPVYYISKCWEICLNHDFSASFNPIVQKNYENVKKILALFKEKAGLQEIEIPYLWDAECSYQATCQAGEIIRSPGLFRNAIDEEEIGNIFRWAANEKMYELLNIYSL